MGIIVNPREQKKTEHNHNGFVSKSFNGIFRMGLCQFMRITLTDPLRPGKLKNTSGPFRCGICRKTVNNLAECRGYIGI